MDKIFGGGEDEAQAHSPSERAAVLGETIPQGVTLGVVRATNLPVTAMQNLVGSSLNTLNGVIGPAGSTGGEAIAVFGQGIAALSPYALSIQQGFTGAISSGFRNPIGPAYSGGSDSVGSFGSGMDAGKGRPWSIAEEIVEHVKKLFGGSLPEIGPLAGGVSMYKGGQSLMEVFAQGLLTKGSWLKMAISGLLGGGVLGPFRETISGWVPDSFGNVFEMINELKGKIPGLFASMGGGARGGAEQWRGLVMFALQALGLPLDWVELTLAQINSESGGNPNALNDWDINAQRGDPTGGLLQNIPSAYRSRLPAWYLAANPGTNVFDPLGSILAGLTYMVSTYGSPHGVWGQGHGYATGGQFWTTGMTPFIAGEASEPELVTIIPKSKINKTKNNGQGATNQHYGDVIIQVLANDIDTAEKATNLITEAALNINRGRLAPGV